MSEPIGISEIIVMTGPCQYCYVVSDERKGEGCEECGYTGRKVITSMRLDDGALLRIHQSEELSAGAQNALADLLKVAARQMDQDDQEH